MRTVRSLLLLLAVALGASFVGCNKTPTPRLKVAVTIFPIYDLTRRIAGPDADVVLLVVPGRPELDIRPTDNEANAMTGAGLGIRVGLGLDDWQVEVLDAVAPRARRLAVGDRVPTLPIKQNAIARGLTRSGVTIDTRAEGKTDPYVWMDPQRAQLMAKAIAEEMARADVAHAAGYRARAVTLDAELSALDHEVEEKVATWGARSFVPFRAAYAYFADRYHLDVAATLEAYPGKAPPIRYYQEVARLIRVKGIGGVFKEPQFAPRSANVVAEASEVPIGVMDAIGGQDPVDSYEKLIRFDLAALDPVMKAPPRPHPIPAPAGGALADAPGD